MNGLMKAATVFAAGAAAMYFLDPVAGRRRRATTRDQTLAAGRELHERLKAMRESENDVFIFVVPQEGGEGHHTAAARARLS